jgi:hypothetical protein
MFHTARECTPHLAVALYRQLHEVLVNFSEQRLELVPIEDLVLVQVYSFEQLLLLLRPLRVSL